MKSCPNLRRLFHLTWDCHIESIRNNGIIPNYRPNEWIVIEAFKRSKAGSFLCSKARKEYWHMTFTDGWVKRPIAAKKLVWLEVRIPGDWVKPDKASNENYRGDFVCKVRIPPEFVISTLSRKYNP